MKTGSGRTSFSIVLQICKGPVSWESREEVSKRKSLKLAYVQKEAAPSSSSELK